MGLRRPAAAAAARDGLRSGHGFWRRARDRALGPAAAAGVLAMLGALLKPQPHGLEMSHKDFERFSALIYANSGISMNSMKFELLRARIAKRLRALGLKSFKDYYELVKEGKEPLELDRMIDVVTTN